MTSVNVIISSKPCLNKSSFLRGILPLLLFKDVQQNSTSQRVNYDLLKNGCCACKHGGPSFIYKSDRKQKRIRGNESLPFL